MMNPNHEPHADNPNHVPQEDPNTVTIVVNDKKIRITTGPHTVAEIKARAEVPAAYEIDQRLGDNLVTLDPNGTVHIKGGEVFVAYPGTGSSS